MKSSILSSWASVMVNKCIICITLKISSSHLNDGLCRSVYLESKELLHLHDLVLEKSSRLLRSLETSRKPIEATEVFL